MNRKEAGREVYCCEIKKRFSTIFHLEASFCSNKLQFNAEKWGNTNDSEGIEQMNGRMGGLGPAHAAETSMRDMEQTKNEKWYCNYGVC